MQSHIAVLFTHELPLRAHAKVASAELLFIRQHIRAVQLLALDARLVLGEQHHQPRRATFAHLDAGFFCLHIRIKLNVDSPWKLGVGLGNFDHAGHVLRTRQAHAVGEGVHLGQHLLLKRGLDGFVANEAVCKLVGKNHRR